MTGFRITRSSATAMAIVMVGASRTTTSKQGPAEATTTEAGIRVPPPPPPIVNVLQLPMLPPTHNHLARRDHYHRRADHNDH